MKTYEKPEVEYNQLISEKEIMSGVPNASIGTGMPPVDTYSRGR